MLNEKLRSQLEAKKILSESQAGFRKNKGIIDNAYILQHVVERETQKPGGKVYTMFVDLKATFDIVKRDKLWRSMENCRIEKSLIERIKEVYEGARNVVRAGEKESEEFWIGIGLRQGCPLSPTLFTIYIAEMEKNLGKEIRGGRGRSRKAEILLPSVCG